jgi:hypothetical protein
MRLLAVLLILLEMAYGQGFFPPQPWNAIWDSFTFPALSLLLLSAFLERGRSWVIALSLLMTAVACIFPLEIVGQIVVAMSRGRAPLAILFPMAFALFVLLGLALLIAELIRARAAIREASDARRGFEPVMNRSSSPIKSFHERPDAEEPRNAE